jgi:hypothetical protein
MPTQRGSRVKLNRRAIDGVRLAIADGVFVFCRTAIEETRPPDAPPLGAGLVREGGALTYVGRRKTDGFSLSGAQPKKPRAVKLGTDDQIVGVAGWDRPSRFDELGTVNQPARPFFRPVVDRLIPRASSIVKRAAAYRIARLR